MKITVNNDLQEIKRLTTELADFGSSERLASKVIHDITLALEEIVTNIISYGYDDFESHEIVIDLQMLADELSVEISDDGTPFNPLEIPPPDLNAPLDEREIGGLGIFLVRQFMDDVAYRHENQRNILTLRKKLSH
ncbi:MAG: ATP-binding protein [Candidatus Eremiobacteraeota bacterium]|nr:ATP-binding protein [Candidatus Eremiobacteraeota bacterium]